MSTHNIGFYEDLTKIIFELSSNTRGDPEICGKVRLNRIAFIDCNENSQT